jgi:hypothetical protein
MNATTHRAFFGDRERDFCLSASQIPELERVTNAGIGELVRRVINRQFRYLDLSETIRLALIGGGATPSEAAALITAYIANRPMNESISLASAILMALWFGPDAKEQAADAQA